MALGVDGAAVVRGACLEGCWGGGMSWVRFPLRARMAYRKQCRAWEAAVRVGFVWRNQGARTSARVGFVRNRESAAVLGPRWVRSGRFIGRRRSGRIDVADRAKLDPGRPCRCGVDDGRRLGRSRPGSRPAAWYALALWRPMTSRPCRTRHTSRVATKPPSMARRPHSAPLEGSLDFVIEPIDWPPWLPLDDRTLDWPGDDVPPR